MYLSAVGRFFVGIIMEQWARKHYEAPSVCIQCGQVLDGKDRGTLDHYIPLCVTGSEAERKKGIDHPFITVVNDPHNLFRVCCEGEHADLDAKKTAAFLGYDPEGDDVQAYLAKIGQPGTERGDPVALVQFLMDNYPITADPRFRIVQIRGMITVNNLLRRTAYGLNGELHPDLKARYYKAAALIGPFNRRLNSLRK
ncbi:MAG: hypothetical protein Q7S44_00100 [bacterium]|nr:hypothetical protein [bacterium]